VADLTAKVALVTGSARGIGAAIATRLARDGASVVVADLDLDDARRAARTIADEGHSAVGVACDVTDASAVEAATDRAVDEFGSIDILVNNAGVTRDNLIHKMTDSDWDLVLNTHLKGSFYTVRAAQRHMVKQRSGKIVFISSRSALGNRGQTNYSAAKAGMQGMTRTLAIELGPFGINVNAIAPGFVETAMTRATAERMGIDFSVMIKEAIAINSIKRVGVPEDIANVAAFLVSEDASYMTGQILYVAGRPTV
jgi:3-oxoacyl-[acyl-carrier protein] reductase